LQAIAEYMLHGKYDYNTADGIKFLAGTPLNKPNIYSQLMPRMNDKAYPVCWNGFSCALKGFFGKYF